MPSVVTWYRLGMRILPLLPLRALYALCDMLAWPLLLVSASTRQAVAANLRHVLPTASRWRRWLLASRLVGYVLRNYVDLIRLPRTSIAALSAQFELTGLEHLDVLKQQGVGGMMAVPHCGSWSSILALLAGLGYPLVLVVEPIQPPELLELISDIRRAHGLEVLPLGPEAGRAVLRALKAGKIIVLAGDRDLAAQGIAVPFFGASAMVPSGPSTFAARGVPTVTAFTAWLADGRKIGRVDCLPQLARTADESSTAAAERAALALVQRFETYIRAFPTSWGVLQPVWDAHKEYL